MDEKKGYFIDGKKQAIDLLKSLEGDERNKILKNIALRNASIAKELSEKSFSFKDLFAIDNESLEKITLMTSPAIIGLALYISPKIFQKRVLSIMGRDKAEVAFNVMNKDLSANRQECLKAQNKLLFNAIELSRRNIIKIN